MSVIIQLWIRVHLGFIRVYFSNGEVEVGELRGRNVPLGERGKERMCSEGE